MSHEIRTPLTSIIGYTRLALQENGLSETARLYVKRVLIASDALGAIIDDVLDFSKLEAGELRFEFCAILVARNSSTIAFRSSGQWPTQKIWN